MDINIKKQGGSFPLTLTVQLLKVDKEDPTNILEYESISDTILEDIDSLRSLTQELAQYNQEQRELSLLNNKDYYLTKKLVNK